MSFTKLLRHRVTVERRVAILDGGGLPTYTELGQPATELRVVHTSVKCRIEPKSAKEVAQLSQAGPVVASHTIYALPGDWTNADRLIDTDGRSFEVLNVPDAGGTGHHVEMDVRRIISEDPPVLAS